MTAQIIPVAVFDLVVFGATGDLSFRKLMPALYWRESDQQMPEGSRIIGVARTQMSTADYVAQVEAACRRHVGDSFDAAVFARFARAHHLRAAGRRQARALGGAGGGAWRAGRTAPRCSTSPPRPTCSARSARVLAAAGIVTPKSRVVLEKPIGRDLASAIRDQRRGRPGLQRSAGLPHRPLSGQGVGPEPAGPALRQLPVRAALEPRAHRPRADHRGRDRGRRGARGLLRQVRRAARHGAEPHAAAAVPRRHGAADLTSTPDAVRDEKLKVLRSLRTDHRRRRAAEHRARPVPRRLRRRRGGAGLRRGAGRAPAAPRPSSRSRPRSTTGAGPACRSTCAPASGCRRGASEIVIQFKAVPHSIFRAGRRDLSSRTAW